MCTPPKEPPSPPPGYLMPFTSEFETPLFGDITMTRNIALTGLTEAEEAAINQGVTHSLWLWGFVRYRDAFKKEHISRFLVTLEDGEVRIDSREGYNEAS